MDDFLHGEPFRHSISFNPHNNLGNRDYCLCFIGTDTVSQGDAVIGQQAWVCK